MTRVVMSAAVAMAIVAAGSTSSRPDHRVAASTTGGETSPEPLWVKRGCESGIYQGRRVVCSVGTASGIADLALGTSVAEANGRASLAAALQANVDTTLKQTAGQYKSAVDGSTTAQNDVSRDLGQGLKAAVRGV